MRDIRFRVWDNGNKAYQQMSATMNVHTGEISDLPGRFILEQFTGLLDKNGKPQYQGDRVKCIMQTNSQICEGIIDWSDRYSAFVIKATTGEGLVDNLADCHEVEIIGTIHDAEHKELAK